MTSAKQLICYDCEKEIDADDSEKLDDDEIRCFNCADTSRAEWKKEQMDKFLDDPRRG